MQSEYGTIDFDPDSMGDVVGGDKLTYDEYLDILMRSGKNVRGWFEMCYFETALEFAGQVEKINKDNICFKRIYVCGMFMDGECFNVNEFVASNDGYCLIVPEVIAYISKKMDIANDFNGVIVDTYKKTQYVPLLEIIGCHRSGTREGLDCIMEAADEMIKDEKFREVLYAYLLLPATQQKLQTQRLYEKVKRLPIFPIRTRSGVEYVPYSKDIYTHDNKVSDNDFKILETKILKYESAQAIIGPNDRINELSQEVYEARYQNNLIAYIRSNRDVKEKAFYVLNEYKNNLTNFRRCHITLKGMISEIPMKFISGSYQTGIWINDYTK